MRKKRVHWHLPLKCWSRHRDANLVPTSPLVDAIATTPSGLGEALVKTLADNDTSRSGVHWYIYPTYKQYIDVVIHHYIQVGLYMVHISILDHWSVTLHGVDPLSYFSFQPVLHDWCNKGRGMYYPVYGMVHIKEPLLLIGKSSPCGGSGFPLSLSEWSLTICLTPYNRR